MIADLYKPYMAPGSIRNEIENMSLKSFGGPINTGPALGEWLKPVEIDEDENFITVTAELPGIDIEDINITIEHSVLTLRDERRKSAGHFTGEKYYGSFHHSIELDADVDITSVKAFFDGKVLEITLPKVADPVSISVEKA